MNTAALNTNMCHFDAFTASPQMSSVFVIYKSKGRDQGYAWSGGGRSILRVDLTADGGKTWTQARGCHQREEGYIFDDLAISDLQNAFEPTKKS